MIDAFRMLDPTGQGTVNIVDIRRGLKNLNLDASNQELAVLMKRFDKDNDNLLRYSEFCEAFLPVDSFHASMLAKKSPVPQMSNSYVFSPNTLDSYRDVWALHLRNEMLVERIRFDNRGTILMQSAFEIVDENKDGYVDKEDVSFSSYNFYSCENFSPSTKFMSLTRTFVHL